MIFRLANREADKAFPLIEDELPMLKKFWKESGMTDYAIEIDTIEDLMSLEALARTTDNSVHGIFISGTTMSIIRKGDNIHDYC